MPKLLMPTDTCTVPSRPKREVLKLSTESHRKWDFFKHGPDCWWYNEPTNDEVAVVFVGEDGAPPVNRDIVVYPRNRLPQRLSYMSCHLDPMCYPIPIHRSNPGWYNGMTHVAEHQTSTHNKITKQQFYSYRLAVPSEFSPIHSSGKLFQQYAVDAYVKMEGCRLYYIRPTLEWTCTQVSIHNIVQCTYMF